MRSRVSNESDIHGRKVFVVSGFTRDGIRLTYQSERQTAIDFNETAWPFKMMAIPYELGFPELEPRQF